jgi:hypothetical protein
LAAVTAALALAVPAAGASAATTAPAVHHHIAFIPVGGLLPSGSLPCLILVHQIQFALLTGNPLLANVLSNVFLYSGCGGAAI